MIDPKFWNGKKVFLTGNTGFKGSWLSLWLMELGSEVFGYSLPPPTTPSLFEELNLDREVNWLEGDVRDLEKISKALSDSHSEIVFHLAAQPLVRESYVDPVGTYGTNVMGTVNLLEAARNAKSVRSVVVVTTDKCYENREWLWGYRENEPMGGFDPYSNSKGCAELVVSAYRNSFFNPDGFGKTHSVALGSARAGNVIGGGDFSKDRLIPDIVRAIKKQENVEIRSPFAIRPWQHVLEPLSGYLLLAKNLFTKGFEFAEAWNFGPRDEDAKTVEWIVQEFCRIWPESKGYEIDKNPQPHEATYLKLDISKSRAKLHWSPKWNIETALKKIVEWENTVDSKLTVTREQIKAYVES